MQPLFEEGHWHSNNNNKKALSLARYTSQNSRKDSQESSVRVPFIEVFLEMHNADSKER